MRHVLDLQKIMAESRDYDELLFAWKGWRDSAGTVLRGDFERYVELANKAATLNGTRLGEESPEESAPLLAATLILLITHRPQRQRSLLALPVRDAHI